MKAEIKRFLMVTEDEQKIISKFIDIMESFGLNFEEDPENLAEIVYTISMKNPYAYLRYDKGTIKIEYQDD